MSIDERSRWRSPELGEARPLDLPGGRIRVHETGSGPAIVFVHGLLVNANLWRKVVPRLAPDFRCVALDLPLGSHVEPLGGGDLTPPALAALVCDALDALGLDDVTLVGNDTGGALCQIAVTTRPERIGRLVLTPCDYRDVFPPKLFKPLLALARVPGATQAVLNSLRPRPARRLPAAYGWLTKRPIEAQAEDTYVLAGLADPAVRSELNAVLAGIDPRHTNEAADRLPGFDRPALLAWAAEDRFFRNGIPESLASTLPNARLEWIEDSYTFVSEDQPERLAELIAGFVREPANARAAA
ncbi:MAG: alpha/beta fold hydrolase [Actinomycetota bacterium]